MIKIAKNVRHAIGQVDHEGFQIVDEPQRPGDIRGEKNEVESLLFSYDRIRAGEIDALDGSVEGVLEEFDEGDMERWADVVADRRGCCGCGVGGNVDGWLEVSNTRRVQSGFIGHGLVETAVCDGSI